MLLLGLFCSCGAQGLLSRCGAQASHCGGFSYCWAQALGHLGFNCGSQALEHRLSSCGPWRLVALQHVESACGTELVFPALAGGLYTTEPPEKPINVGSSKSCILDRRTEKAMAPHSSTLAWKIPWTKGPGGLQSMGSRRVGHDWATSLSLFTFMHWRRKWQPTPVFLPGESQGWGSLVGCDYGVAQSQTRL